MANIVSGRDRDQTYTIPAPQQKMTGRPCPICFGPVKDNKHGHGIKLYCSDTCHRKARVINQAENLKRKRLRRVRPDLAYVPVGDIAARQVNQTNIPKSCWSCRQKGIETLITPENGCRDASKSDGFANICKLCRSEKAKAYYDKKGDTPRPTGESLKQASARRKREYRAQAWAPSPVPDLSPRVLKTVTDNLREIVESLTDLGRNALLKALSEGRVNGMCFEDRSGCGCVWGTVGRAEGWSVEEEGQRAKPFRAKWCAEFELFGRIVPGDTPDNNPYARIAYDIIRGI